MNLIAPATLVSLACASLLSPRMVTAHEQGRLGRYVRPAAAFVVVVAIAYWGLLAVFAPQL
ncbi:MAG TPA: hypothetical protein VLJ39_17710, partial [Tepidisphaeraceae bacterium]|nr:hypothetical protein [Tepidisphaeraceae bacterium]